MPTRSLSDVVRHLRRVVLVRDGAGQTDGQLLESFVANRDDDAFAALLRRHAPMVWGVCRRILHSHQDAEDAFQTVFLVLVRKAAKVVPRDMVANWLYGVAHQTALKARATTAKRHARERQVTAMPEPLAADRDTWSDLQTLLDQELSRLPDKYRLPIILCDLEGKTRKQAAQQLGVAEGTIASRLARARALLAKRLGRQGLAVSAASLTALVAQHAAAASVPTAVVSSTIKAASLLAAGQAVAACAISAKVAALTEGVLKAMLLSKLKIAVALLVTAGIAAVGAGMGGMRYYTQAAEKPAGASTNAGVPGPQEQKKTVGPKGKKDVDWKEVEKEILRFGVRELEDVHGQKVDKIQDCRSCHLGLGEDQKAITPKHRAETDQEKITRLEGELQKLRGENELLQLEVWVLLKELQRQTAHNKGAK